MITCIPGPDDRNAHDVPNLLDVTHGSHPRVPVVVVLFYLPYHWSDPAAGLLFAAAGHHRLA